MFQKFISILMTTAMFILAVPAYADFSGFMTGFAQAGTEKLKKRKEEAQEQAVQDSHMSEYLECRKSHYIPSAFNIFYALVRQSAQCTITVRDNFRKNFPDTPSIWYILGYQTEDDSPISSVEQEHIESLSKQENQCMMPVIKYSDLKDDKVKNYILAIKILMQQKKALERSFLSNKISRQQLVNSLAKAAADYNVKLSQITYEANNENASIDVQQDNLCTTQLQGRQQTYQMEKMQKTLNQQQELLEQQREEIENTRRAADNASYEANRARQALETAR